jgi:hypothetical protein
MSLAFLCSVVLQVPSYSHAFTPKQSSVTPARKQNNSGLGKRQGAVRKMRKSVSFLAWEDNRLVTTAGTFIIDESVEVVDTAGSRDLEAGFEGPLPSVKLIYKDRQLVKVIIE